MSKKSVLVLAILFLGAVAAGIFFFKNTSSFSGNTITVDWKLLGELDYITGQGSKEIHAIDGQYVRVPGFMVPLEDNEQNVVEFLLVPSPQACIHVPPPPPNQMVLVKMNEGAHAEYSFSPIWIYGKLRIHSKRHEFGESSFYIEGEKVEPYQ